jgi:hypothetical protein
MRRVSLHVRPINNFGDDVERNVERAWLLPTFIDPFYLKRRADEPSIAQDNFGYAVPDGGDLHRGCRPEFGGCRPESEGEGLSIAECHIFADFLLKLTNRSRIGRYRLEVYRQNNDLPLG